MKPSEMFDAKPETFKRINVAHLSARCTPSTFVKRGLWRIAESSRCSTNQFSNQPATILDVKSTRPVNAAHSSVGPSNDSEPST